MKKIFLLIISIAVIVGCSAPKTQAVPTVPFASETLTIRPTATIIPSTATVSPTPVPELGGLPDDTLPHGLGVSIHYQFFADTYMPEPQYFLLRDANIGLVRDDMWPGAACGKPPWCFEYFDKLVQNMARINVRVIYNLRDYENSDIGTEEARKEFARFAGDSAAHFKGQGVIWELWNEPDLNEYWRPYSNPHDYALLVDETVQAIRTADPDAVIIGPSVSTLSTIYTNNTWKFLNTIGEEGTLSRFDAVDVHLYNGGSPESQIENLRKLRRLIDSYSPDRKIPIVSTEWGYTTGGEYYGHRSTPEEQPKYLARAFLVKAAHEINLSIWYDWKDDDWDPNGGAEQHFGTITAEGEPKPAYYALQTLTTTLDGYHFVRRIAAESPHDYLLLFRNGASGVLAAWTISEPHPLAFTGISSDMEVLAMLGERSTLQPDEAGLLLQLTDSPQYLMLADGSLGPENVFWKPQGTFFRLDDAGHGEIPVEIENPSSQDQTFNLQAYLNDEVVGSLEVTLTPNEIQTIHLPLEIQPKADEFDFLVKITSTNYEGIQTAWVWLQK